jgi:hypothetical protein
VARSRLFHGQRWETRAALIFQRGDLNQMGDRPRRPGGLGGKDTGYDVIDNF